MPAPRRLAGTHTAPWSPQPRAPGTPALGDALLAQMWHRPAPRAREDGKRRSRTSHQPHSKGAKLKNNHPKKNLKNPPNPKKQHTTSRLLKPAIFVCVSRNTSVLKTKGWGGELPFHRHRKCPRDEVQNSSLTSKAFLLAGYPEPWHDPLESSEGNHRLLPSPKIPSKEGGASRGQRQPSRAPSAGCGQPPGVGWDPRSPLSFAGKAQSRPPFLLTLP